MLGLILIIAVIDQIDAPIALVEINQGRFVEVDARCLPARAEEGDQVLVMLRARGECPVRGLWVARR